MNETVITLFGAIDRYWYNKNYLKYFLDKAKGQPVRLKVSSYGGDVAEAVAMSALMAEHGNVTVERKKGETYRVATGDAEKKSSNQGNSQI